MGNEPMKLTFGANALDLVNSPDPKRCFGHDKWSTKENIGKSGFG
ncbi:hypothetical protein MTsPCn9_35110 [Croceitalea sp. MTPC9]|nr:hypothetical protein MTsPCn6_35040 [Croceitalea sp. MTPC6]GMN18571.1 hypothetical protein MTsPCn9_35110 [Croceitalea sp. MTPC9]